MGATLPVSPDQGNSNISSARSLNVVDFGLWGRESPEYLEYREALRDPALWSLQAEERHAWNTEAQLVHGPFEYSKPLVVPFYVAVPNVNYPPGIGYSSWSSDGSGNEREVLSKHAYHYTAVVEFASGRSVDVPAGHTTFHPVPPPVYSNAPFIANYTFEKSSRCGNSREFDDCEANVQTTTFGAEVLIEGGTTVRQGDTIEGRVTVHRLENGSTSAAANINYRITTSQNHRWARTQAELGGDGAAFLPPCPSTHSYSQELNTFSSQYDHITLSDSHDSWGCSLRLDPPGSFNENLPQSFELKVDADSIRSFRTYYSTSEAFLTISLMIACPQDVETCKYGDESPFLEDVHDSSDVDAIEEGLWDMWTPIGAAHTSRRHSRLYPLLVKVPITIIGPESKGAFARPFPVDYLIPDVQSPVLLASTPLRGKGIKFPVSQPVITTEPTEDTAKRMLAPYGMGKYSLDGDIPNPTRHYQSGPHAGLLWRKKILAEDMMGGDVPTGAEQSSFRTPRYLKSTRPS